MSIRIAIIHYAMLRRSYGTRLLTPRRMLEVCGVRFWRQR